MKVRVKHVKIGTVIDGVRFINPMKKWIGKTIDVRLQDIRKHGRVYADFWSWHEDWLESKELDYDRLTR